MMFGKLNASEFRHDFTFYKNEFEGILTGIIACYGHMVSSGLKLKNNENEIRDIMLLQYLKVKSFKKKYSNLINYHFDSETSENSGRVDIRVLSVNPYIDDNTYYIIECKKVNNRNTTGSTGLNAEYIKNGICRFVTDYYSSYFGINGMIGFVIDNIDIDENIANINSLLKQDFINDRDKKVNAKAVQNITRIDLSCDFNFTYTSTHRTESQNGIVLYHLMLDFSGNMQ